MYNKKVLIDSLKKLGSATAPPKKKDIIIDPRGQWAHPGENTRIPSDKITMKGVNYPVLGIANTGQKQMMQPEQEYNFPGADYVDEYPQMQEGGEQGCPEGYAFNPKTGECIEWNPDIRESYDQPTSFDPVGDVIYMNPNDRPEGMSDEEYAQMYNDQLEHEQLHRLQWKNDDLKGFDRTPLRMPSTVDNQEYEGAHYYNRRGEEEAYLHDMWNQANPDLRRFIPEDVVYDKEINPVMYELPWTEEGEARGYEGALHNGMESFFPKKQDGGEKDKWGRPKGSKWYGFDPKTKKYTTKDNWGRSPEDKWYGFNPDNKSWSLANQGNKTNKGPAPKEYKLEEDIIDPLLGSPQKKGAKFANGVDNLRHSMASYYTAKGLEPYLGTPASIVGANVLGAAHEVKRIFQDPDDWSTKLRTSGEDMFNNAVGSAMSILPESWAKGSLKYLSDNNLLPDGVDYEGRDAYVKKYGGVPQYAPGGVAGPCPPYCGGLTAAENITNALSRITRSNLNPLSYPIKNIGYKIAKQTSAPFRSSHQIKQGLLGKSEDVYFGQNYDLKNGELLYGPGKRDLLKLYFFGDETGMLPTNYDFSSDPGLDAMVQKYGPLKAFLLNSEKGHGQTLNAYNFNETEIFNDELENYRPLLNYKLNTINYGVDPKGNFIPKVASLPMLSPSLLESSFNNPENKEQIEIVKEQIKNRLNNLFEEYQSDVVPIDIRPTLKGRQMGQPSIKQPRLTLFANPVDPMDNIGGHMGFLKRLPNGELQWVTRDIWSFRPEAYNKKWGVPESKHVQSKLMDMFGKPFILTQTNPIKFKKGGSTPKLPGKKNSKAYSRSLEATNKFFAEHPFFAKPKSRKNKIYDPNAKYYQDGGVPYDYNEFVSNEPESIENPIPFNPKRTENDPKDYDQFLKYSETAPENRRPNETYFYGDSDNYDHYGMWDALGKPKDFQQALEMNPDWQPDPYDGYYHGFSVNPNTGVFLKSGKPGFKPGDTTWMEIAGHYLSPRAQEDTPVFDPDLQRFKYIPNEENGDYIELDLSPEEIEQYAKGGYVVEELPEMQPGGWPPGTGLIKTGGKLLTGLEKLTPGNALRNLIYSGVNPASYSIKDKVIAFPKEIWKSTTQNDTRPFRVGFSLGFGAPELMDQFYRRYNISEKEFLKMSDAEKMMLFDDATRETMIDIGKRRLDAFATGLLLPQEYETLEQIGDDTYRMKDLFYTPQFFSDRHSDIRAYDLKNTTNGYLTADENFAKQQALREISKEHYDLSLHPLLQRGYAENPVEQEILEKWSGSPRSFLDEILGTPKTFHGPWHQVRHVAPSTINPDKLFTHSVWDNDKYGVMGGFRWDVGETPEGIHWQANDIWDINPFEKRGSAHLKPSDLTKKYLHMFEYEPLQNLEALSLVGGKPFKIQNNFLLEPKTFKILKQWKKGGLTKFVNGGNNDCPPGYTYDPETGNCLKDQFLKEVKLYAENPQWKKDRDTYGKDYISWYESFNPKKWGLNDYSDYSSFNSAFRNARESGEDEFVYKGNRYSTELIPQAESDLYNESKDFLTEYYKTQPYKKIEDYEYGHTDNINKYFKKKYGNTLDEIYDKQEKYEKSNDTRNPKYIKLLEQAQEYSMISLKENKEYDSWYMANVLNKQRNDRLKSLYKPSYFSITTQKPKDMLEDGYWDPANNKTFMLATSKPGKLNTTYVHELSHKGDDVLDVYTSIPPIDIKKANQSPYIKTWDQNAFNYISDPSEIEARKLSTLFYLKKNKIPWKSGSITKETLDKLYNDYSNKKLPYDIEQLLELYGVQQEDLLKYLNSQYDYKKQYGGLMKFVNGGDNDCPEGYIKDENGNCIPANYDPNVANENTEFLKSMANSPLFVERYARMVGKPLEEVTQEAEDYRKQILQNLETVGMGDSAYPPEPYKSGNIDAAAYYLLTPNMDKYSKSLNDLQLLINKVPNKGKRNKELRAKYQTMHDEAKKDYDEKLRTGHKLYFDVNQWDQPTDLHERSHASVKGDLQVAKPYKHKDFSKEQYPLVKEHLENRYPEDKKWYYEDADEIKARKDVAAKVMMKLGLYDPVNETFTPEHYKKLRKLMESGELDADTERQLQDITRPFTEEETIRMFNDIVQNDYDQDIQYGKYGGQFELGDEVDEATMKQLMKLGYTFEKI